MNLLQLLLKLVLKLVEPILGIFRSQSSNRNRQNSSEPKPVRGFRSIFVSDSSNRNEQNPSYSQLKTPRPSGQTFILEPMLTPSGLLDGGDDSSDGLDGSDVADIELPAELDPEPTSDETGEVNGTEVEDAESEDLEEIGFAQNEETTTGEAQTEEEVPFAEEGSDDATGESQQDLNNSTESATDETSQELGTSQTEEQANTSESEGEVEESSETTVSETTDTEESDTGAEVIDEQANSSETTDTESDAADEEMNASETESSEVEDENADEGESLTEETTDVPDTSETETADTDNESADDGEAVAETTSSTQENQDRDSEEQSTSESESPANSDESVETDSVVENGAEITIGSDESFSEDTEATSENELEAETTEPDESVVTDEADSEEPDDSTEETVSDSVASVHNENELSFDSGIFVVGENGKVSVDFLFDGGSYRGELGMFSLAGMDEFDPNSEEFIREAARRSLSDSTLGHVVISDRSEGARFTAELDEGNWNSGEYRGVQTFTMRPEDEFAVMLVPQGSVEQVFDNPWSGGARRPLFSLATANPSDTFHVGQIVDVVGDGSTFAMEDLRADSWTDRDYNDIIFQFRGARGSAQQIDTLISDRHDWRDTDFGRGLYDYVRPYEVREDIDRPETDGVNSSTDNVEKNSDDNSSLSSKNDAEEVTEDEIEDNSSTEEGNPQNTNYDSDSTHRDRPETESNLDSETEPETSDSSDDFQDDGNDIDVDDHPDEDSHLESETSNDLDSTIADNFSTGETEERDSQTPTDRSNPEDRDRTETASNLDSNTDRVETSHSSDNTHNEDSEVDRSDRPDRNSNSEAETGNHLERPIADNSSTEATEAGDSQTAIDDTDSVNRDRPSETPVSSNPNQSEPNPPGSELNDTSTEVNSPATTPSATETQSNHLPSSEPSSDSTEPHPSSPDSTVNLAERIDTSQGDRTVVGLVGQGADPQHPALQDRVVVSGEDRIDGDNNSFVASDEGQHDNEILNIFNTPDHRNPIWFSRAVGSGEWTDSIVEFVDTLQDSGQSRGVLNLSFDLVQINDNGNIETRYEFTPDERAAIEFARQHGVLIVASAGNDGAAMSILGQASQEFDNIVTVGAAQENNPTATPALAFDRAESSSYGYGLDLVAPGDRADGSEMGSSLATARVTEAVSRVWDANPDLNYRQIVEILKRTATDLRDPNWDPHTGAGLLNVAAAINFAKAIDAQTYAVPEIEPTETWSGAGQVRPSERPTDANGDRPEGSSTQTTEIDTSFRRPYVVRPGDTLWTIAQRELDSGYRWREIQAADGSYFAVEDNDRLSVGTTVYLPVIYLRNTGLDIPLYSPDAEFELQVSSFQTEGESIPLTALVEPQFKRNLDRIELNLKPDGGDWQDLPDLTDFTINDQGQIVFETELPPSDIGHYQIEAIAYDNNGNEIDRHNSNFAVTSSPDLDGYGFDLPDPVRMGIIQSADLSSYDTANIATAREWVIGIPPSESADAIASDLADLGASNAGATDIIPSTYTLSFPEGTDPTKIAARVSQQDSVKFFYPLVLYDLKSQDAEWRHNQRLVDGELWHLPKAKVTEAWDTGLPWNSKQSVSGDRVNIGVVDDGVDFRHPDLAGNYREDLSKDFNGNPPDSFDPAQFLADLPEGWWEEFQAKLHNPELAREDLENSELRQDEQWWSMYWSWLNGEDITLTENWWGMYWSWLSASASLNWDEQWWGMYWSWLNVSDPVETDEQWWRMYWSWLSESEMAVDEQWWGMYWSWLSESDYSVDPQWWSMYWSWLNDSELGSYVELSDQWWGMYWSWLSDRAEGNASWQNLSPDDLNLAADEQWWGMYWSWLSDPNLEFDEQWWGMYWSWLANSDLAFNEQWWGMYWSWLSSASYETNAQWWGMYWSWLDDSASTALQEQWWGMYWSWLSEVSIDEQWWGMYWSWLSDAVLDSQLDLQEQWWQMYWSWLDDSSVEVDEQWWGMYWSWLNGGEPSINEQWWGMYWSWLNGQSPGLGVQSEGLSLLDSGLTPQDSNQTRPDFLHGTAVSGIAAANGDREGVVGAAPDANLASLRLLANNVTDFTIASALTHENDEIDLYNNSWKAGSLIAPPMSLMALHLGASQGRAGLGSNQIFAGGNDGNRRERSDYNAFANSRHTISVAANDYTGQQSTTYRDGEFSWASEPGASLLVTSPSSGNHRGVTTTDITTGGYSSGNAEDGGYYTDRFGGTSAAAPLVSGIVALMLEVNPNLTQRDIQHILVETANRDLISDPYVEWSGNAGDDLRHNDRYGFGAIDAEAAIQAAANWTPVDPEVLVSGSATIDRAIPDYNYKAEEPNSIASTISISEDIQVEWAEIVFDADHPYRGDLEVRLTSPDGTESVLAEMREDSRGNYKWVFTSARHWGESSLGDWTLTVTDQRSGSEGTWNNWKLNLYGTTEIPTDPWLQQLGTDGLDRFRGVAVDDLGYVYAAGSTQGAFDKDATARGEDAMVVKFDPDGRLMWAQQSETPGNDAYNHIAVDKKGYIYTIGSDSRGNETAVLLTKWNRQGDRVWAQTLDSAPDGTIEYDTEGADFGSSISTDGNGNIYIAGTTDRSIRNLGGTQDGFVAKYNPGGRLIWSDELDSNRDDAARSVFSDDLGNTYVVGVTDGNLGGDNAGDTDLFLRKYDVLGNEVWTRQIGSSAADGYFDEFDRDAVAAVDGEGNIYLVATTEGEFDGQSHAGGRDIAIAKYNADGDRVWTKQIGTDRDDRAWGVSVDRANTVYITGETRGNLNGHVNAGGWDAVTIALDGDGNHLVTETLATEADDRAFDIRIDSQGNVYQVGSTAGALTGSGTGNDDAWIVKNYIKPTVYLETLDGAAGEDGNVAQFAFKRSGNLEQPLTVRYDVAGDATPGADYRELSGTVTFPAGSAVAMLPTIALADAEVEADETVEVSIAPDATYQISGDRDRAVATISDNTGASTYGPFTYVNPDNGHVYLLSPPETWVGAQGYAESLSGHLVAIDDEAEDRWLNETFGSQQYFHIGLTDSELYGNQEDDYQWVNGQPLNYTNWQADEPNNVGEGEDFALNNWEEAGKWNDIANDVIEPGIIEIDPNQLDRPIVLITATDAKAGEDGNAGQLLITRIGNTDEALNVNYSVAGDAVNGVDYESLSGNVTIPEGESLVTIPIHVLSDRELEDPETIAIDLEAGDYNIGSLQTTTVEIADRHPINQIANAIIGRDVAKLEYWNDRWQNGETLEELRPAIIAEAYDGSGNSDAEMAIDAIYQDVLGRSATASEIATWRSRLETDTTLSQVRQELQGAEPIDTLNYVYIHPETGKRYVLSQPDTWLGAQEQAERLGGNLVAIDDASENQWLVNTLDPQHLWIGLTDSPLYGLSEGEFQWVSGASAEFTNWWSTVPDNVLFTPEGEDFTETNFYSEEAGLGVWNDLSSSWGIKPGIIELPAEPPTVTLSVTDAEASEDGDAGQFVVSRTGDINTPLTVRYNIAGDATNGVDYQDLDGTITIPAGSRQATLPVVANYDYDAEAEETVQLTLVEDDSTYQVDSDEDSGIVAIANSTQTSRYGPFVYVNPETGNLYVLSDNDTWLGAQEQAEALGGNLVTINDDRENTWLTDTFGDRDFWIGFTDSDVYGNREGEFEWVSGEASSYTNWLPTEPTGDGNSTEINFASETYGVGGWNDRSHDSKIQSGIIEVDPTSLDRPIVNVMVTDDRAGENGDAGQIVIQRIGNIDRSLSVNYSLGGDATNGSDFQTLSGNIIIPAGETLVTLPIIPLPDDEIEGNETLVVNLAEGDYETGTHSSGHIIITDQNPINRLYQEVLERNAEPTGLAYWTNRWQNGESLTELRWLMAHDPFHTESVIKINQIYQDIEGRTATPEEMSYWRSRLGTDTSLSQVRQQIEGAEFIINTNNPVYTNPTTGNRYFLTTPDTWLGAQEQAQALGGNLVTVDNADENQWLFDTLGNGPKWIGLNDSPIYGNTEGNHQWMNGEATYTNWWPTEPNNASSVTPEGEDFSETNFGTPGLWNDMPSQQNFLRRGIVEIPAPIADNPWIRQYSYNWTRTHFGEDLHDGDNNTRLDATPQLDNARDRFLANLVNVETADLEGFASGDTPATLTLGNTTATLSGNLEVYDVPTATEGGTFPTSGDRYLLSSHDESFRIDFSDPQSAFGFNVTDSEGGPFVLTLHREDGTTEDLRIPVQADWPQNSGSALFFGVTDLETPFTAVTIHKPAASERLGIDDITVAQVNPDRPSLATPPNRTLYLAYTEDRALDLSDIVVSSPTDEATVTLTVSDPNAGTLTIPTSNNATATYDPQTGVWEASGNVADLNALLSEVQFVPRENAHGDLDIDLRVDADNRPSLHGTIALTGLAVNDPPQLSAIAPLSGATQHQPFTITYDDLLATSDATDVDGDEIAFTIDNLESGTLTKNGEPVELGETAIAPGEELVWTPDTFGDAVAAFTVTATDGQSSSPTPVAVAIATAESPISFHNPDRAYRSFDDSPFKYQPFRYFHLEDWESGQLDAPGMSLSGGAIASPSDPDAEVDSVDIDDGAIDGEGVQGRSWATDDNSLTLTFDEAELGSLPTHVGFALTQLTGTDNSIQLEAFDAQGNSLGVRDFDPLPPQGVDGETAQDRFFGIESDSGIASLQITANRPMSERLEIDHIQYGEIDPDAPPTLSETDTYYDDRYISGDWDGDGTDNIATVRDRAIAMDTDFDALPDLLHWFGDPHASQFLVGDWNGDGKDTVAYLKGNTVYIDFNRDGNIDESRQFGIGTQADEYLVGDWNADGIEELAYRVGNTIYFDTDGDLELTFGDENTQIDRYWTADWNGDGQDDIAYRIGDTIYIDTDLDGEADRTIADLGNEDGYLVGDWDGDGTDEFAVRRGDSIWTNPDADTPLQRFGYGTNGDRYTYWNSRMLSGTRLYLENESLPLGDRYVYDFNQNLQLQTSELQIGDRDPNETVTVRLSLSDASAGHLISGAIDNTTATYDSDTGVWTAQGSVEAINQLLQTVEFEPTPGYNDNLIVTASVSDETSETAMGSLALFGQSTNDTPTVTTSNVILTDATESAPYTITYEDLVAATGTTDADGDTLSFRIESVGADIPTKDGEPVDPGVTSLSPGEAIVWTPTTAGQGQLAFTATVSDGEVTAETPIEVSLDVNPITVSLEATDPDATEGSDPGEFTFTRTGDTTNPMTVNFTIEPSINWGRPQAGNGTDYETIPTSITIPEGESSVTLTITSLEDTETEWPETVRLQLDEGEGYEINSSEHLDTVVIWDNETPKLRLYGKWYSGQPENFHQASYTSESGNNETFLLRRIGSLEEDLTVYYSLPGTATNGEDYEELPGSITIPAGQRDITFAMTIIDDDEIEGDETVELTLTPDPTYTFMNHAGRIWDRIPVTIVDNDDKPTVEITVSDNQASEYGDPGQFTISRTGDTSNPLTVDYWISTGWWHKAKNGIDYEAIPESITIPAGESSITIDINPIDDSELEEDEIVDIYLKSNPNYAMSGTYYAKLKILDNETQSLQWQQQFGTSGEDIANSTATDSAGNTYTAGHTSGDLGGTSIGGDDAFIVKRDSSGNEQWRLQLGTTQDDSAKQIAVDRADNLYVLGWSDDPSNSWIAKYDSNGNQQWQKPLGDDGYDITNGALTLGDDGSLYITGRTTGDLDGTNQGETDAWVAKYDSEGNPQWRQQFGTPHADEALAVAVDGNDNVFLTGYTQGALAGTREGDGDVWVAMYEPINNSQQTQLAWKTQLGTQSKDVATSIAVDNNGRVYIGGQTFGWFGETYDGDADDWVGDRQAWWDAIHGDRSGLGGTYYGNGDAWVAQLNSNDGSSNWKRLLGTEEADNLTTVVTDELGNVYLSGMTEGKLGDSQFGGKDVYLVKYDVKGALQWKKQFGSDGEDDVGDLILTDTGIFLTGNTSADFGGSNQGGKDGWLTKLS